MGEVHQRGVILIGAIRDDGAPVKLPATVVPRVLVEVAAADQDVDVVFGTGEGVENQAVDFTAGSLAVDLEVGRSDVVVMLCWETRTYGCAACNCVMNCSTPSAENSPCASVASGW